MACKYRKMELKDIPEVLGMCEEFYNLSAMAEMTSWDPEYVENILGLLIDKEDFYGLIAEDNGEILGMITAVKVPSTFFNGYQASEQVWWVKPQYRTKPYIGLKLFNHCWKWALDNDCKMFTAGEAAGVSTVSEMYKRLGFTKIDSTWMKRL